MSHITVISLLLFTVGFWLSALRARERALGLSRRACENHGVQLLDQTVALTRLRLAWHHEGLRLRRTYTFEFSEEGIGRNSGRLILRGLELEQLHFDCARADL